MTRRAFDFLILVAVLTFVIPSASGQGVEPAMVPAATLPESNEAVLLSSQAEDAIRRGDYRLAFELIDRTRQLGAGLVPAPASRTYYPVWRHAQRLLEQLPPLGVEAYRSLHDGEVAARLELAARAADMRELRELFRVFRLSSHWAAAGRELAALLLDSGSYAEAIEVLQELRRAAPDDLVTALQLATALARSGAPAAAERLLHDLQQPSGPAADAAKRPRQWTVVSEWLASAPAAQMARGAALDPQLMSALEWSAPLALAPGDGPRDRDEDIALAIRAERKLPLITPVVSDERLVVRAAGRLTSFDLPTLSPAWSVSESGAALGRAAPERQLLRVSGTDSVEVTFETHLLLTHALRHAVSAGAGMVYTIEGLKREAPGQPSPFRVAGAARSATQANELVARDLSTGEVIWRLGGDPSSPFFGVIFQAAPLVQGDHLIVPIVRRDGLLLAVLDARRGEPLREVLVVAPPTRFTPEGGRVLLAADESRLFVGTGNGVVAAFGLKDLEWQWATTYPSTLGSFLGRMWWQPETSVAESGIDPLLLAHDLIIIAPVDTTEIYALDRHSGRERWHAPRGEYTFLVGVGAAGLVAGGNGLTCLSLEDGRTVRWRTVPLEITGRPALTGERIYVPTRRGLLVLDAATGKVLQDPFFELRPDAPDAQNRAATAAGQPLASNLLALHDALLLVSPNHVVKLPDVERTRARLARGGAAVEPSAQIESAWLAALERHYDQALTQLRSVETEDPTLRVARDSLLAQVCTVLAREAAHDDERLDWLAQAAALTSDPRDAAQLAALVGDALVTAGRVDEAFKHYHSLLGKRADNFRATTEDGLLSQVGSVLALQRLTRLISDLPAAEADRRWAQLIDAVNDADHEGGLLALLQRVLPDHLRARAARLLCLRKLPPELAPRYLAEIDDASLSAEDRRRLLIERWDTHVALGLLEPARNDEEAWNADSGHPSAPALSDAERDRLELIRIAQAKLERGQAASWSGDSARLTRLWKLADSQAVLDPRAPRPLAAGLIVRNVESDRLELHEALRGGLRREEPAELRERGGEPAVEEESGPALGADEVWPAVFREHLVALPVPGGLICRGLGIERYGGTRLWERPVPEWTAVPRDFARTACAGEHGVYFCPRPGQVALVDWISGRLLWERELPDRQVARMFDTDGRLIVLTTDGHVFSLHAVFGDDMRFRALGAGARVEPINQYLVAASAQGVAGLDPHTLETRWSRPVMGIERVCAIAGANGLAYHTAAEPGWNVVSADDGSLLLSGSVRNMGLVHAWVRDADGMWIVAGRKSSDADELLLAGLEPDGKIAWESAIETRDAPTVSQLAGHPQFIPVLVLRRTSSGDEVDRRSLAIQMVERRTGSLQAPLSIDTYFPEGRNPVKVYMVCSPTLMLVQGFGCVVAFGASP